ncbi:hypothetical protein GCM10019016_044120 [Streptomyces prasinosporus]|uniref:Uncharacterized protein n=1 Tax=Streptomyces prasinosporus TaxID=68256 RepID=A0ABP6TSA7_9ACTN
MRHYRGTADLARAARDASDANRGPLAAAAERVRHGRGAVRRLPRRPGTGSARSGTGSVSSTGSADAPVTVASTTLLYGFGAPAEVRLPGREDIYAGRIAQE